MGQGLGWWAGKGNRLVSCWLILVISSQPSSHMYGHSLWQKCDTSENDSFLLLFWAHKNGFLANNNMHIIRVVFFGIFSLPFIANIDENDWKWYEKWLNPINLNSHSFLKNNTLNNKSFHATKINTKEIINKMSLGVVIHFISKCLAANFSSPSPTLLI
jgi:hypothetical protein